jgi:guanylate kinase
MSNETEPAFGPCPEADVEESNAPTTPADVTLPPPSPEDASLYACVNQKEPVVVVISGPSGVGKDAAVGKIKGPNFHFVVTATSRPPRPEEVDGVDYHFLTEKQFEDLLVQDELLEHALVYGQYKGIPKQQVREALASGKDVIMRLDVQGAATIRKIMPEAILIFLTAASEEELIHRLMRRDTETSDGLQTRINTAREEMKRYSEFDYVIVNSHCQLSEAVEQIEAIIRAEKCRVGRRQVSL